MVLPTSFIYYGCIKSYSKKKHISCTQNDFHCSSKLNMKINKKNLKEAGRKKRKKNKYK